MPSSLSTLAMSTYVQALLIARGKGMKGQDAKYAALHATARSLSKRTGHKIDADEIERIVSNHDTNFAA